MGFNKALYMHVFVCQDTPHVPAGINLKPAFPCKSTGIHIHTHTYPATPLNSQHSHTHHTTGTPHTLFLVWNIVGGAGPVEGSVNSSGATPPFERPKFPFLRSAAWAGSAVQQAFSRHGRPQRPRWQHFTGTMAWQGWPDGPPHISHWHTHIVHAYITHTSAFSHAFMYLCVYKWVCACVCAHSLKHTPYVFTCLQGDKCRSQYTHPCTDK